MQSHPSSVICAVRSLLRRRVVQQKQLVDDLPMITQQADGKAIPRPPPPESSGASLVSIKAACHGKQANRGRMTKHEGAKNSIWLTWTIPIHQKQNGTEMNMW